MDGQPPAVEVIRLVAEQIEKPTIHEGGYEIESAVRIRQDHKQRCLLVAQGIQLQFVIFHQIPQLLDIERYKPGAAGNQYTFECLARNELSRTFYQKNKQQYYLLHYACCVCHLAV